MQPCFKEYFFPGGRGGGGTPLKGLNGDVRPARVCFSGFLSLNRVSILSFFVLIRVSVYQFLS